MSSIGDKVRANPMTWKDWITAAGMLLTLSTVLLQGGRLIERQEVANTKLAELTSQLNQLRQDLAMAQRDLTAQRGADAVHDSEIRALRRDVDILGQNQRSR
jgi:hypothetical protein